MSNPKKQSFLGGAAILAAAVAIVKLIGAAYKLPLNNILGDVGMSYWDTAYKIYNFLLTFSTAGLPLAISKLTSEAYTQGRENEKRKIFRTAIWLFFALGLVGSLLMFFQADLLVGFLRNALNILGVNPYWQGTAIGAVIVVAVLAEKLSKLKVRKTTK